MIKRDILLLRVTGVYIYSPVNTTVYLITSDGKLGKEVSNCAAVFPRCKLHVDNFIGNNFREIRVVNNRVLGK